MRIEWHQKQKKSQPIFTSWLPEKISMLYTAKSVHLYSCITTKKYTINFYFLHDSYKIKDVLFFLYILGLLVRSVQINHEPKWGRERGRERNMKMNVRLIYCAAKDKRCFSQKPRAKNKPLSVSIVERTAIRVRTKL